MGYLAKAKSVMQGEAGASAINAPDDPQAHFDERIAIVQHDAGLPAEWAEAFARMDCCKRPALISAKTWRHIMDHTGLLLDRHIHAIIKQGWTVADIFGCHYAKPENRYDAMGLLLLLGNAEVIRVEQDKIAVRTFTGNEQFYYRTRLMRPAEQVMIWELK